MCVLLAEKFCGTIAKPMLTPAMLSINDYTISLASDLEHKGDRTAEESAILDLLLILIEKFEEEHYPIPEASPHSLILHLLESNAMTPEDLVGVLGSTEAVNEVINSSFEDFKFRL